MDIGRTQRKFAWFLSMCLATASLIATMLTKEYENFVFLQILSGKPLTEFHPLVVAICWTTTFLAILGTVMIPTIYAAKTTNSIVYSDIPKEWHKKVVSKLRVERFVPAEKFARIMQWTTLIITTFIWITLLLVCMMITGVISGEEIDWKNIRWEDESWRKALLEFVTLLSIFIPTTAYCIGDGVSTKRNFMLMFEEKNNVIESKDSVITQQNEKIQQLEGKIRELEKTNKTLENGKQELQIDYDRLVEENREFLRYTMLIDGYKRITRFFDRKK